MRSVAYGRGGMRFEQKQLLSRSSHKRKMSSGEIKPFTTVCVIYTTSMMLEVEGDLNTDEVAEKILAGDFTVLGPEDEPTEEELQEAVVKAISEGNYDDSGRSDTGDALYPLLIDGRPYLDDPAEGKLE